MPREEHPRRRGARPPRRAHQGARPLGRAEGHRLKKRSKLREHSSLAAFGFGGVLVVVLFVSVLLVSLLLAPLWLPFLLVSNARERRRRAEEDAQYAAWRQQQEGTRWIAYGTNPRRRRVVEEEILPHLASWHPLLFERAARSDDAPETRFRWRLANHQAPVKMPKLLRVRGALPHSVSLRDAVTRRVAGDIGREELCAQVDALAGGTDA